MKRLKKLKILFNLFLILSLFPLVSAKAMNEKNKFSNDKEIFSEKGKKDKKEEVRKYVKENKECDDIKEMGLVDVEKHNEKVFNGENEEELPDSTNMLKKQDEKKDIVKNDGEIIKEKLEEFSQEELEELKKLPQKFLENVEQVDFDSIFQNIFSSFGYSGKKNLEGGYPHIFVIPYSVKYKTLANGEKNVANYGASCNEELFSYPDEIFNNIKKTFGPYILNEIFHFYQFCFNDRLNFPVTFYRDGKKHSFSREVLEYYFKIAITNKQDFKNACGDLVKFFLTNLYLKSFFLNNYADCYGFDDGVMEYVLTFSKIISKALEVEFNDDGLPNFYLDFNKVIEKEYKEVEKEDKKFLKRLCNIVLNKGERDSFLDELLYDLYNATSAFLQNKEFWNKMLGIIVNYCCQEVRRKDYKYEGIGSSFSEEYFNFYSLIDKEMNNLLVTKNNNEQSFEINFNKDVQDYDFGLPSTSLYGRFKKIFSLLNAEKKKNYFDLLSNKKQDSKKVNEEDDMYLFVKQNPYLKDFSIMELQISNNLFKHWYSRFRKSFGMLLSFDYFIRRFDDLADFGNSNIFKLLGHNNLSISDEVMLKCSNFALQNARIREECFDLIRYMFSFFSVYGFIKFYGNLGNKGDILTLQLVEYLGSILDVRFEENIDKKLELKLSFKKYNKNNYFAKKIIDAIDKFQNKENWEKATEEEKLVYRLFLTAKSFVDADYFWNKFISFMVFSNQFMVAKNYSSDEKRLYDEYKKSNEKIGKDEVFLKSIKRELDKNIVNFITGKNCRDIKEVPGFRNKEFLKDYFALQNNKDFLQERFKKNMDIFRKNLNFSNLSLEDINIINHKYYLRRYSSVFSCGTVESILIKFNRFLSSYEEGKFNENFSKTFYKDFLENKEIANECISSIEKFFYYYMTKLIPKCYSEEYDQFLKHFGKGFVESILKWYVRVFSVKVKDGKLNFNFDLGYFEGDICKFADEFVKVFYKYKNKENNESFFQSEGIKERAERFLYSVYVDAFAFLSSEDFWNAFMSDLIYKKIVVLQKGEVSSKTELYKTFKNVLKDVEKKIVEINKHYIKEKNE